MHALIFRFLIRNYFVYDEEKPLSLLNVLTIKTNICNAIEKSLPDFILTPFFNI